MFCSYSFEKLLCWTCRLTASIHRWTQRPCESQRSWNDRKVALFWFWSTLQREHFNLPSCFKTTFWPCEGHKSCLVSRQTTLTTAHGRSEQVWETCETAKYHRLDFNKHSENTLWACFFSSAWDELGARASHWPWEMTSAGHRSRKTLTPVEIGATAQHRKCQTHLNPQCMQNLTHCTILWVAAEVVKVLKIVAAD